MLALLLLLLTCLAVPNLGIPAPCFQADDTVLSQLKYQECLFRQIFQDEDGFNNVFDEDPAANDVAIDLDPNDENDITDDGEGESSRLQKRKGGDARREKEMQWLRELARLLGKFQHQNNGDIDSKRSADEHLANSELLRMMSDYYQWRKRNGRHGNSSGRWGRSIREQTPPADPDMIDFIKHVLRSGLAEEMGKQKLGRLIQMLRKRKLSKKLSGTVSKREDPILAEYKQWRGENGYGQASGRWG